MISSCWIGCVVFGFAFLDHIWLAPQTRNTNRFKANNKCILLCPLIHAFSFCSWLLDCFLNKPHCLCINQTTEVKEIYKFFIRFRSRVFPHAWFHAGCRHRRLTERQQQPQQQYSFGVFIWKTLAFARWLQILDIGCMAEYSCVRTF